MRRLEALGIALALGGFAATIWELGAIASGAGAVAAGVMAICWQAGRWQVVILLVACALLLPLGFMSAGSGATNFILVTVAILTALGLALLWLMPVPTLPLPSGPHKVGLAIAPVVGERPLLLYAWYPAAADQGIAGRKFHTKREAQAIAKGLKVAGAPGFLHSNLRLVVSHSVDGATAAEGRFPLVLFNHGGAMFPTQNFSLMQELASRGIVCVSIGRPESLGLAWPDGNESTLAEETVEQMKGSDAFQKAVQDYLTRTDEDGSDELYVALRDAPDNSLTPLCEHWAEDTMRALAALQDAGETGPLSDLAKSIDFEKRAYVGMSLGGAVSMQLSEQDEEALACVNLDGMNWSLPPLGQALNVPCLQFYSDPNLVRAAAAVASDEKSQPIALHSDLELYNDRFFERIDLTSSRLIMKGIGHMGLTDMALGVRRGFGAVLGLGNAASSSSVEHMNVILAAFLADRFSQDEDGSGLDAAIAEAEADGLAVPLSD